MDNLLTLGAVSPGFKPDSNQTFFGATGVTISVLGKTSFRLTDGKIISITISGTLTQSSYSSITLNNIESVIVGSTVTSIDSRAFQGATSLQSITIPNNVTNIGDYAFQDATSLKSIPIPISVKSIGSNAFLGSGLKTAVFDSVTNVKSLGFTIGSGQTFYGAQGVTISAVDYSPKTAVTKYYYPGVDSSTIQPLDTSGYTRCDVLIVGSGGNAGTVTYTNYGTPHTIPIFDLGGAGGGGASASFTNITCNPLGGNIQFSITQSGSSWVLNNWVKDGTALTSCKLVAGNGGDGVNPWGSPPFTTPVTGGAGGISNNLSSTTGLPSGVVLTTNNGATGSTGIYSWSWEPTSDSDWLLPNYPPLPAGGKPGDILTNFTLPNPNSGKGSGYQQISGAFNVIMGSSGRPFTIKGQAPGVAFIQVNLYNV